MSHRALAVFLEDFSGRPRPSLERERKPDPVELARLSARAEALEEARLAQEEVLRDLEERHQRELSVARDNWIGSEGARLDEALSRVKAELAEEIAALLADCLQPFLAASARATALDAFAAQMRDLLEPDAGLRLKISGAPDYLAALRARLGGRASACDFVESNDVDLEASLAGSVVTLRLAEWLAALQSHES